jgi:hypothetical protein
MSNEKSQQPTAEPAENPAVARCQAAWLHAKKVARTRRYTSYKTFSFANNAFSNAMPPLSTLESIRDFIACVAHGILIGVFSTEQSTRLLYAAQVAISAQRKTTAPRKEKAEA